MEVFIVIYYFDRLSKCVPERMFWTRGDAENYVGEQMKALYLHDLKSNDYETIIKEWKKEGLHHIDNYEIRRIKLMPDPSFFR